MWDQKIVLTLRKILETLLAFVYSVGKLEETKGRVVYLLERTLGQSYDSPKGEKLIGSWLSRGWNYTSGLKMYNLQNWECVPLSAYYWNINNFINKANKG